MPYSLLIDTHSATPQKILNMKLKRNTPKEGQDQNDKNRLEKCHVESMEEASKKK